MGKNGAGGLCPSENRVITQGSGRGGIRTLDTAVRYTGFRDRPIQPLSHPSGVTTMKYTEKRQDFQRTIRTLRCLMVFCTLFVARTIAQEIPWPTPAAAPEVLVGLQAGLESYDRFFSPLQSISLFAGSRSRAGTFIGRVSAGQRADHQGFQAEAENYPILGDRSYAYLGYAWGSGDPFARHRGGVEYFTALPAAFEVSGGMRVYQFHDRRTVVLGTGTLARYTGNFWFSGRPYISVNLRRPAVSATLAGRYYFGEKEEFWFARIGAGFTPDERSTLTATGMPGIEVFTLHAQSVGGGVQALLAPRLFGMLDVSLTRQEVAFRRGTYVVNASLLCGIRFSR